MKIKQGIQLHILCYLASKGDGGGKKKSHINDATQVGQVQDGIQCVGCVSYS